MKCPSLDGDKSSFFRTDISIQLALKQLPCGHQSVVLSSNLHGVADQAFAETGSELWSEIANLISVGKQHISGRHRANHLLRCRRVAVRRILREQRMLYGNY